MAVVRAFQYFQLYLSGTHFRVRTDNTGVRYWRSIEAPVPSIILKWRAYLASFDFEIEHQAGRHNSVADTLSRFPNAVPNTQLRPARVRASERECVQSALVLSEPISVHYTKELKRVVSAIKHQV